MHGWEQQGTHLQHGCDGARGADAGGVAQGHLVAAHFIQRCRHARCCCRPHLPLPPRRENPVMKRCRLLHAAGIIAALRSNEV
jgi:hypothetical protein